MDPDTGIISEELFEILMFSLFLFSNILTFKIGSLRILSDSGCGLSLSQISCKEVDFSFSLVLSLVWLCWLDLSKT